MEEEKEIVCGRDLTQCLRMIEKFHGWKAPGLVLGLFMVDLAQELIGIETEADAIVETRHCLPDAIQLFTPCTAGNGWMKILDWDKFALSLYDRRERSGYRVWFDLVKARRFPNLYKWFMRLVPKKELPLDVLLESILSAGRSVLSSQAIYVTGYYQRRKKSGISVCPVCTEAFASAQGETCWSCQGNNYYEWKIYPNAVVKGI
ncbi:MAG: formylmethanofuran dehydrogenase subunit E family protein [Desulfobacterales bacterium]